MKNGKWKPGLCLLVLVAAALVAWSLWKNDAPRRDSLALLDRVGASVKAANIPEILEHIRLPGHLRSRSEAEQVDFMSKVLPREISDAGLSKLRSEASFGRLEEMFPEEGVNWATGAGVDIKQCFAFKAGTLPVRTEVVLFQDQDRYRIIRLNNVN